MRSLVVRIVILNVMFQMATITSRVTSSLNGIDIGGSALEIGMMMALFAFAPALCSIQVGRWIDRTGPHMPILAGLVLTALASLVPAFLQPAQFGIWPLFLCCAIAGLGMQFTILSGQQLVGHISDNKNRTSNFAILALGYSTASLLAPVSCGWVMDHLGYRASFLFAFGCVMAGALLFFIFWRAFPKSFNTKRNAKPGSSFELLKNKPVRNVLIASAFMSMAWDLQSFMIPIYGKSIGMSASEIGWLLGAFASATFTVRLFMGTISRYLNEWQTITTSFALGCTAYCLFPLASNFFFLLVVAFLLGMALGASQPNVMSLLHSETPPGRQGEAIGIRTLVTHLCHAVLPIVFGGAGAVIGIGTVFWIVGGLMGGVSYFSSRCEKYSRGHGL